MLEQYLPFMWLIIFGNIENLILASQGVVEGVNPKVVASMEGHRSQTTTFERYDHDRWLDEEKQKIVNNIVLLPLKIEAK